LLHTGLIDLAVGVVQIRAQIRCKRRGHAGEVRELLSIGADDHGGWPDVDAQFAG